MYLKISDRDIDVLYFILVKEAFSFKKKRVRDVVAKRLVRWTPNRAADRVLIPVSVP